MAIKVGLSAIQVPSAVGVRKPAGAQPAKVLVWRQPAKPRAGGSTIFQPKIPAQPARTQLPFRPVGPIDPPKATTGMPQRQTMKQPTFGNWPKATTAVPGASAETPAPTSEQAVTTAPTGRTVTAAADALPQDKPNESAGGAYVDTTGGGEVTSVLEEAAVTAENAVKTEAAAVAQTGRAGLGWVAGVGVAIGAYLYLRRKK